MCQDLGWQCWWTSARASAIALLYACESDHQDFAHTRLSADGQRLAPGSWMDSVAKLRRCIGGDGLVVSSPCGSAARKREIATFRKRVIIPAFAANHGESPTHGALPWAWIAANGDVTFPRVAFEAWWQLRCLGTTHPRRRCAWCFSEACCKTHLESECQPFAVWCWTTGVWRHSRSRQTRTGSRPCFSSLPGCVRLGAAVEGEAVVLAGSCAAASI